MQLLLYLYKAIIKQCIILKFPIMANNRETVASYWLDKRRKLTITRYQFRKNTTVKYWIEIENTLTNSLFKLPGLTKDDLKNINELIEAIETSLEW